MRVFKMPIQRVLEVNVVEYEGKYYARTRELASFLGVKQQYELNADIKRVSSDYILNYDKTKDFRQADDEPRTTYIELINFLEYLENCVIIHKMILGKKFELIQYLKRLYQ